MPDPRPNMLSAPESATSANTPSFRDGHWPVLAGSAILVGSVAASLCLSERVAPPASGPQSSAAFALPIRGTAAALLLLESQVHPALQQGHKDREMALLRSEAPDHSQFNCYSPLVRTIGAAIGRRPGPRSGGSEFRWLRSGRV